MIEYYRSGTGSGGAVNVEYATNILDGFENSNLNFNKTIVEDYKEWLKDHPFDNLSLIHIFYQMCSIW